jgi:hypothetical protein
MIDLATLPDATGHFGQYGGMFVPETLMTNFLELTAEYEKAKVDPAFQAELKYYLHDYVGRPTPLYFAERLTKRDPNAIAWLPGWGMILSVAFFLWAFTTTNLWFCLIGLCVGVALKYSYLTGQYTIAQGVVSAQRRAVAVAIVLFVVNLLGYGLGPLFIGALSDFLFNLQVADLGAADLARKACEGAAVKSLSADLQAVCKIAHPQSLQTSMLITSAFYAVGGAFFLLCMRWLQRDMVAR